MSETVSARVIVAGTGPAGLTAALSLAQAGFTVELVGPDIRADDRRTTALMAPSLAFLQTLGVAAKLREQAAPLRVMRIVDATSRLVRSPPVTFRAAEIDEDFFGLNIPNAHLNRVLEEAVVEHPGIEWRHTTVSAWRLQPDRAVAILADGNEAEGLLVAAADGRASPAREAAGIITRRTALPQSALVLSGSRPNSTPRPAPSRRSRCPASAPAWCGWCAPRWRRNSPDFPTKSFRGGSRRRCSPCSAR
jgi:2-octaprenyl-6-methoxyphenol hydroxylase